MLERHNSGGNLLQRQNSVNRFSKHSLLQRQKSRSAILKQKTCLNLYNQSKTPSNASNAPCKALFKEENSNHVRLKHLLLKHSKIGFIENFSSLSLSPIIRKISASDELVGTPFQDNIEFNDEIAAKIIEKDDFELGRVLGSGGFGSVYEGIFRNEKAAIKMMHKFTKNPVAQRESFRAEFHVMRFNHPNIVKTLAATHMDKFDQGAWVVMEYVGASNLNTLLHDPTENFNSERCLKFSHQIASALSYAHKNRIAHLDLKPANILIDEDGNCKVGDFGCSQKVEIDIGVISPTNRSSLTGTFAYRAPELLRGEPPTFKADIYSFGITMWQLKSRESPYANQNQHVVIFGVVANGLRPNDPNPLETDPFELSYKDLYKQCWHACPLDRPSAHELLDLLTVWKVYL